ncbi:hypothetical protein [Streptomyces sp. R35]|uniref:Uncharacterized protein n=1 Tax=Streptomyces sp. R35 TaxID=3238630 RepID=A0AB39SNS7_9ACTN
MDLATLHDAGTHPSAVLLGPLPTKDIDLQLARKLRDVGRVMFQEYDTVLNRLLPPAST